MQIVIRNEEIKVMKKEKGLSMVAIILAVVIGLVIVGVIFLIDFLD